MACTMYDINHARSIAFAKIDTPFRITKLNKSEEKISKPICVLLVILRIYAENLMALMYYV